MIAPLYADEVARGYYGVVRPEESMTPGRLIAYRKYKKVSRLVPTVYTCIKPPSPDLYL